MSAVTLGTTMAEDPSGPRRPLSAPTLSFVSLGLSRKSWLIGSLICLVGVVVSAFIPWQFVSLAPRPRLSSVLFLLPPVRVLPCAATV